MHNIKGDVRQTASVNIHFHSLYGKKEKLSALHLLLCSEESLTGLDQHEDEYMMAELYLFIIKFNLACCCHCQIIMHLLIEFSFPFNLRLKFRFYHSLSFSAKSFEIELISLTLYKKVY